MRDKEASLSLERLKSIIEYNQETGDFRWIERRRGINLGSKVGCRRSDGQIIIGIDGRDYRAHRLAWLYTYGCWPKDEIDHIDRDRTNNKISNLREATRSQNQCNVDCPSSHERGTYRLPNSKKWYARIKFNKKTTYLGSFNTEAEAAAARAMAAKEIHAEFTYVPGRR